MTVRLFAAVVWCAIGALVVALCASESFAGRSRPALIVRACPEVILSVADPRSCATGYAEGSVDPMDASWPTRDEVCAELVRRCG